MKRILIIGFLSIIGILLGAVLNNFFPLNFTIYFLICILSLLLCKYIDNKAKLIIPWAVTATASVFITLNYLHPDISVYSNADYNVLVMEGVDKKDSVILVGNKKKNALFDREQMEGNVYITPSSNASNNCMLHYDLKAEPLFAVVNGSRTGRLINKGQLPSFRNHLIIENDSIQCDIIITEFEQDSINVKVTFAPDGTKKEPYSPSFKQPINIGYNLYDILHSGTSYEENEESLLCLLRHSIIVRDYDDKDQGIYYLTHTHSMEPLRLVCDGQLYNTKKGLQTVEIDEDTYFYIGIGSQATRPMKASYDNGNICLRYRFPYINNFPRTSDGSSIKGNEQKVLAVTTKTSSLLKTSVNEAFYYPLFEREDNEYNFNGNINYRINNSQTPFITQLTDDHISGASLPNVLTAKNGAIWHFNICDLRQSSPITGEGNIYVKDTTIFGVVFLLLFLTFLYSMILTNGHFSKIMMIACLFAIPLFVMRIYLLWRIAVFPPVTDISLNEFLRYRMELSESWYENPMLITIVLWTAPLIALLSLVGLRKISNKFEGNGGWHKFLCIFIILSSVAIAIIIKIAHINVVGLNILVPVILFLINEYIIMRGLSIGFRIANALIALIALIVNDPGYAIMFFIFESIYYTIILYSYLKYRWKEYSSGKAAGFYLFMVLLALLVITIIWLPDIVAFSYSNELFLGGLIGKSRFAFIVIPLLIGGTLLGVIWRWKQLNKKWGVIGIASVLLVVVLSSTMGYNYFQNHNLHFKYRAIIHTEKVGEIMKDEMYDHNNSQRLLNAAQNQWFLQYHINKGEKRITEDGIISLLPHFKKGVTWNTQLSDVVLSRYVIGELSGLVPIMMILLSLVLLWIIFQTENYSPAGRAITFAVVLLFVVQSTFEWMAVTNRTVFFGQDFPFLSQNARSTLGMFGIWIMLLVIFACHKPKGEYNEGLGEGLEAFSKRFPQTVFFTLFTFICCCIFAFGNNYDKLYASKEAEGDKMNAEEFNISEAIKRSMDELVEINARLSEYPVTGKKLENDEDISSLFQDIDETIHLTDYVNKLKEDGRINDFTFSLYQAFEVNLKRKNSNRNIIHLRHHDTNSYEFALNVSYFSLQSPEYDKNAWKGNIYSDHSSQMKNNSLSIEELPGIIIYTIPRSWLPSNTDYAIADSRIKDGHIGDNYKRFIHKEMADYTASAAIFPILPNDILELNDKKRNDIITYQYGREEQGLLVKNMMINGKRKFFYPLRDKCLWLRDFSNLITYSKQGSGSRDSVFVTLDNKLTECISDLLRKIGNDCSVVVMDGWGNVRLMADHKRSGAIDPNNEDLINELAIQSYMNPNPETDQNLFGNLNLCYMKPGPGSSLKPITYAAVTSQSQDIIWPELELMSPSQIKDTTVCRVVGKYYHVRKFGPQYKYSAKRPFKSIANDEKGIENNGIGWINNEFYLYQSSNYYNALITYLGHYDNLANAENHIFTVSSNANDFPRFRTKKGGRIYTFREAPQAKSNQILFDGLTKNFKVPTFTGYVDTLRYEFINHAYYRRNNVESKSKLANRFSWVFPQASTIYDYEMKDSELTPTERLRQYTLGSDPIKVTPIKMAEMYGKLFSLHPDFHASITPRTTGFTEPWLDRSGNPSEKFFNFYRENLYRGMEKCVQIGTAKYLTKDIKGYHLYAKTGTLSLRDGVNDDRMLAVIISNQNLIDNEVIKSSDDYKYMVVYFRFKQLDPELGHFWNTVNEIIKEIINSNSFNNYMK